MGLILNHDDPSECFVLFPIAAPMEEIYYLSENPLWVGAHMYLVIKKPHPNIFPIVSKLLAGKALEDGEEYEYMPTEPLDPRGAGGPGKHSTPKRGEEPVATALAKQSPWKHRSFNKLCLLSNRCKADRMPIWAQPMMCPQSFRHY